MYDYDKPKIEIYMNQNAYNLFRAQCDDRLFKKITLSDVRLSECKSVAEKRSIASLGYKFMLEVPEKYANPIWTFINSNPEIGTGVYVEEIKKDVITTHEQPAKTIVESIEATIEPVAKIILNEQKNKPNSADQMPKSILTQDMRKYPTPDQEIFEIYMTENAYKKLRAICTKRILDKVTFGTIKYDHKKRKIVKQGYTFMLQVPENNSREVWQLINSNYDIRSGTYDGTTHTEYHSKPKTQQNVQYLIQQKKTTKHKHSETDLGQNQFKFQDLTPELVGKILGINSYDFDAIYFYNHKSKYFDNYDELRELIETHPFYAGRKLAAVAIVAAMPYEHLPYFIKNPTIVHKGTRNTYPEYKYDIRGTFISYNTNTKQFEKHPAGWAILSSKEKPINAFLSIVKSRTDYIMSKFADTQNIK